MIEFHTIIKEGKIINFRNGLILYIFSRNSSVVSQEVIRCIAYLSIGSIFSTERDITYRYRQFNSGLVFHKCDLICSKLDLMIFNFTVFEKELQPNPY